MAERLFKLPVCGFKSLDGSIWVNAPTADMLIEVIYPMIESECLKIPEREKILAFLEEHYPFTGLSKSLSALTEMVLLFCKEEEKE
ncbi:hypothetical protein KAH37_08895 [bacterium]|nr:hypothetical protein [bacterium]